MIINIIFGFLMGWTLTSQINYLTIKFFKKEVMCEKCTTFWLSLIFFLITNESMFNTLLIASAASFAIELKQYLIDYLEKKIYG